MRGLALFAGGGGLEMAAEMLWPEHRLIGYSELDGPACTVFERRWPDVPNLGDVTAIDWQALGPVDVITAGFPCQDISHAGRRAGIKEGTRSGLWFRVDDAIRVLRPRLVLLENVAAIASPGGGLDVVLGSLAALGFDAEWGVLRASDVGAPHRRERWFCVAQDADGEPRHQRWQPAPGQEEGGRSRADVGGRGRTPAADATVDGRTEGRTGPGQRPGGAGQPASHRGAATDPDVEGLEGREPARRRDVPAGRDSWGDYWPAISRWEAITGRFAPAPTDERGRLNPPFVEWMMGWPPGHTDGVTRAQALKILGNGVVPAQAAVAYAQLLTRIVETA